MPIGAGKTFVAEMLITRIRAADWAAVYFCAHTNELVTQPAARFEEIGLHHGYVKAGLLGDSTAGVQVCSAQTLVNREVVPPPANDGTPHRRCVVFVDECHRVRSGTYQRILENLSRAFEHTYVVGLSATPYRRDGRGLAGMFDALVEATTPREGIAEGWLVDPVVYSRPPREVESDLALNIGADQPDARGTEAMMSAPVVGDIVRTWLQHAGGAPTVARCVNRAHARDVAARFRAAGVRAEHIDGTMPDEARGCLLARLAIGGQASSHWAALDVLTSGGTILDEGFDSASSYRHLLSRPALWCHGEWADAAVARVATLGDDQRAAYMADLVGAYAGRECVDDAPPPYTPLACLVDAAPTTARGGWVQRMGRVCRAFTAVDAAAWDARGLRAAVKAGATVLCHSGNLEQHGYLAQHEGFQLSGDRAGAPAVKVSAYPAFRPPQTVSCPHCFATVARGAAACPVCGASSEEVAAPALPEERQDVELRRRVWDPSSAPPASDGDKESFLRSQWAAWARARGSGKAYSPHWPAARFKAKYGAWPDWGMNRAIGRVFGGKV